MGYPLNESRRSRPIGAIGAGLLFCLATIGAVRFMRPSAVLPTEAVTTEPAKPVVVGASASADAFGRSGNVMVRFALPGRQVAFPVDVSGGLDSLQYSWVKVEDTTAFEPARPLTVDLTIAPARPGFYRIALVRGAQREILPEPILAVMVPFDQKIAGRLNGYNIGTYVAERFGQEEHDRPDGFVEVRPENLEVPVSKHLRLGDFVTHDEQGDVWPKYVALNPKLLDKLELVFADLGGSVRPDLAVGVHSGFRTPLHNARVPRAASDSRHQYGDAADLAIDADFDGKITLHDQLLVMLAVERVELKYPDLVGGLGVYTSRRYPTPYVHIDARGKRSRWTG
jgi:Peptidase M15